MNITYTGGDVGEIVDSMSHSGKLSSIDLPNKQMTIIGDLDPAEDVVIPAMEFSDPSTYKLAKLNITHLNDSAVALPTNSLAPGGNWSGFDVDPVNDPVPGSQAHSPFIMRLLIGVKDPFKVHQFLVNQTTSASTSTTFIQNTFWLSSRWLAGAQLPVRLAPNVNSGLTNVSAGYRANHGHFYLGIDNTKSGGADGASIDFTMSRKDAPLWQQVSGYDQTPAHRVTFMDSSGATRPWQSHDLPPLWVINSSDYPSNTGTLEDYFWMWQETKVYKDDWNSMPDPMPKLVNFKLDQLNLDMGNSPTFETDNNLRGKVVTVYDGLGVIGNQSFTITDNDKVNMTVTEVINQNFKDAVDTGVNPVYYKVVTSNEPLLTINVNAAGFPASKLRKQQTYLEKELQDKFIPANLSLLLSLNIG